MEIPTWIIILLEIIYGVIVIALAIYGFNTLFLTWRRMRQTKSTNKLRANQGNDLPRVTIQLPVYNERYVVKRLIDSVAALDYPKELLEIQVLDDSDDITSDIVSQVVTYHRNLGVDIRHIQRSNRVGYKGGALAHGMLNARGEFVAIFDADFIPNPDFLQATILYFVEDTNIGCVQARWGHTNSDSSWLTRAQATGIDGHFLIEQETRSAGGFLLNFNGTAGIWRRSCIEDAGGWQSDTLTEDLDLSYRAQLRGWRILYLPHISVPAELPVHINAFKRQQFRWAKGSIQTARKMLPELWRSTQPLRNKIEGSIHLTHYVVHPLILVNLFLTLPVLLLNSRFFWTIHLFTTAAIGPLLMYWISMREEGQSIQERLSHLIGLLFLGMGLSVNNTRAFTEASLGIKTSFLRTPKFNLQGGEGAGENHDYMLPRDANFWIEALLGVYSVGLLAYVILIGAWGLVFWVLLYAGGFSYVAGLSYIQSLPRNAKSKPGRLTLSQESKESKLIGG